MGSNQGTPILHVQQTHRLLGKDSREEILKGALHTKPHEVQVPPREPIRVGVEST